MKRILALGGVILLIALYVITLVMALTDNTGSMRMFEASIVATIIIPVLIWTYSFIYKLIKGNDEDSDHSSAK